MSQATPTEIVNATYKLKYHFSIHPVERWHMIPDPAPRAVYLSGLFTAQIFDEPNGITRLTVSSRIPDPDRPGCGLGNITWDELMLIKCALGFADQDAVEVYPPIKDVVNVANMRHLWVLPEPLPFVWRKEEKEDQPQKDSALSSNEP